MRHRPACRRATRAVPCAPVKMDCAASATNHHVSHSAASRTHGSAGARTSPSTRPPTPLDRDAGRGLPYSLESLATDLVLNPYGTDKGLVADPWPRGPHAHGSGLSASHFSSQARLRRLSGIGDHIHDHAPLQHLRHPALHARRAGLNHAVHSDSQASAPGWNTDSAR